MSEISNSQQAQTALFQKLGIKTMSERNGETSQTLGQDDFLRLMTSQLQNQDPFAPMENRDFIAQMADMVRINQMLGIFRHIFLVYLNNLYFVLNFIIKQIKKLYRSKLQVNL